MTSKHVSNKIDPTLTALLMEIDELKTIAKRTETRLCLLAHHVGAGHVGSPIKPTKEKASERHD